MCKRALTEPDSTGFVSLCFIKNYHSETHVAGTLRVNRWSKLGNRTSHVAVTTELTNYTGRKSDKNEVIVVFGRLTATSAMLARTSVSILFFDLTTQSAQHWKPIQRDSQDEEAVYQERLNDGRSDTRRVHVHGDGPPLPCQVWSVTPVSDRILWVYFV